MERESDTSSFLRRLDQNIQLLQILLGERSEIQSLDSASAVQDGQSDNVALQDA